jgi:hypothetical protein
MQRRLREVDREAREYRVYALPVTSNKSGTNQYMFRIRLNIPSDAQFPVFDINIKLPPEVAQKASATRWYDEITINKKPIKNEGRFRITAPMAANDYESLITPVQMDKAGNNIPRSSSRSAWVFSERWRRCRLFEELNLRVHGRKSV